MKLLRVDSSARKNSVTRKLTAKFVAEWKHENPDGKVMERDLSIMSFPLITDEWVEASHMDSAQWKPEHKQALASSDELVAELRDADVVVIGAPMYNFSIPFPLKAWIDHIVRSGKTFSYGQNGYKGLLESKKVVVVTARAGAYRPGTPTEKIDFQEPYLKFILGFIGLTDVTFIHAENQAQQTAGASVTAAAEQLTKIATEHRAASAH